MLTAIKHGLANLLNFSGRDARQAFWFYVLFLYLVQMAIGFVASIPMMVEMMTASFRVGTTHAQDPLAIQAAVREASLGALDRNMPAMIWAGMASVLLMLLGLAAALVRRLHDSGASGWWALVPAGLELYKLADIPSQVAQTRAVMAAQMAGPAALASVYKSIGAGALVGWAGILMVVALGVRKSTPGPNRYGEAPFIA